SSDLFSTVRAQAGFGGPFDAPSAVAETASNDTTYAPTPTPESAIRSVNALPRGSGAVSHRPLQRWSPIDSSTGRPSTSAIRQRGSKPGNGTSGTTVALTTSPSRAWKPISCGPEAS